MPEMVLCTFCYPPVNLQEKLGWIDFTGKCFDAKE